MGAGKIEEKVKALGCRVNPETGKVSTRQNSKGRDVVRARIWKIYAEHYRAEYRAAEKLPPARRKRRQYAIRKEIGKRPELTSFVDEHELRPDADAKALVYDTIRRGESSSK